ncbi:FGGY-family carbohydrate kinase [Thioclava nitratireducens]|uniref:FGGY-family carbohydrate kinase n=1 Tax=Thioclava nitratireducens TaxID=1915078 RepID=UPI0024810A81|nr:FGGY-family carbohydrate kinase [Thioclava nitratireducens]WGT49543.1 FGGY-family carbohydrate kinase [Thioclava nitratireducens]
MTAPRHIAVIDVGKTNAKLALVDAESLEEIAIVTRPNRVLPGPPWPHFDLEGHWAFFLEHLSAFHAEHGVDAISVTTHGASAVLLDDECQLAVPMLDYEHDGPEAVAAEYDRLRPDFAQTGSPRLPVGLNLGAQLHWQFSTWPDLHDRVAHIVTYPQYWGLLLTGNLATDVTSLGCHTDLWSPWERRFSELPQRLGIAEKIAPPQQPGRVLGTLRDELAERTGIAPKTPVMVGIHDSNASLLPYLGSEEPFSVVSTGTWVIAMAIGADRKTLDPARDTLINVNAQGAPVPSARFMGGREYELLREGSDAAPTPQACADILAQGGMILPSAVPGTGPFPDHALEWIGEAASPGERMAAIGFYLAMMTESCLNLIGARGPAIVEGPFASNPAYLDMLAALRPEGVKVAQSATGTSVGAAMLALTENAPPKARSHQQPEQADALRVYFERWREAILQEA